MPRWGELGAAFAAAESPGHYRNAAFARGRGAPVSRETRVVDPCECEHAHEAHEHYTAPSDTRCSACRCAVFTPLRVTWRRIVRRIWTGRW